MPPRMTAPLVKVVSALLADPAADRFGLDIMHDTGLASGTLYPVLVRLRTAGWLSLRWEDDAEGRPPRRLYRLTPTGVEAGRVELAARSLRRSRATRTFGKAAQA
jgi:PadR family transcriptional regulator PadR